MEVNAKEIEMIDDIITLVGGVDNINTVMHCSTRLRFTVKREDAVNMDQLKSLEGILGAQWKAGQLQVIIGQKVGRIYEMLIERYKMDGTGEVPDDYEEKKKISFSSILDFLAGCLSPCLPCILGGGLLKGLISLFVMIGVLVPETGFHTLLTIVSDVPFYFLPFLLAITAAKKVGTDQMMAVAIAGMLLYPTVIDNAGTSISVFGLPITYVKYSGSVIPVILSVLVLKYVYKWINRVIPDVMRMLFAPVFVFIIMAVISLGITGPIGYYLSSYVAWAVNWLFELSPIVAGFIVGFTRQFIVFTGMHLSLTSIILSNIEAYGYDPLIAIYGISALAVAGASFGAFMRLKNKNNKQVALSAGISAVLGITEPGLYGILVRFKWPFMAVSIASGVGGAVSAIFGGHGYTVSTPSIITLSIFEDTMPVVALSYAIAFVIAFALTYIRPLDETAEKSERALAAEKKLVIKVNKEDTTVTSPVKGKLESLSSVNDKTFASGVVGKGMAVVPNDGTLYAPVNGKVSMVFETKHAIGFETEQGDEILVHVGLETVDLKGEGFNINVQVGQQVKQGEIIGTFDLEKIKEKGYDPTVIVVAPQCNREIVEEKLQEVESKNQMFTIKA